MVRPGLAALHLPDRHYHGKYTPDKMAGMGGSAKTYMPASNYGAAPCI